MPTILNFTYHARVPTEGLAAFEAQQRVARIYKNKLIEIRRAAQTCEQWARRLVCPDLDEAAVERDAATEEVETHLTKMRAARAATRTRKADEPSGLAEAKARKKAALAAFKEASALVRGPTPPSPKGCPGAPKEAEPNKPGRLGRSVVKASKVEEHAWRYVKPPVDPSTSPPAPGPNATWETIGRCVSALFALGSVQALPAEEAAVGHVRLAAAGGGGGVAPMAAPAPAPAAGHYRCALCGATAPPTQPPGPRWAALDDIRTKMHEAELFAQKEARARAVENGLYWPNYQRQDEAVGRMKGPTPPRFVRFTLDGETAVHPGNSGRIFSTEEALACEGLELRVRICSRAEFLGPELTARRAAYGLPVVSSRSKKGEFAIVSLRVGSKAEGKKRNEPEWLVIPVRLHRPLPKGATIKWAWLQRETRGYTEARHHRWRIGFTLHLPESPAPVILTARKRAVAPHSAQR